MWGRRGGPDSFASACEPRNGGTPAPACGTRLAANPGSNPLLETRLDRCAAAEFQCERPRRFGSEKVSYCGSTPWTPNARPVRLRCDTPGLSATGASVTPGSGILLRPSRNPPHEFVQPRSMSGEASSVSYVYRGFRAVISPDNLLKTFAHHSCGSLFTVSPLYLIPGRLKIGRVASRIRYLIEEGLTSCGRCGDHSRLGQIRSADVRLRRAARQGLITC